MQASFQKIVKSISNNPIVVYGLPVTPYYGVNALTNLKRLGIHPSYLADTYRYGGFYYDLKILSPDELFELDKRESITVVIYSQSYIHEIYTYLTYSEFRGRILCLPVFLEEKDSFTFPLPDEKKDVFEEDIKKIHANLGDNVSKDILNLLIKGRNELSPDCFTKAYDLSIMNSGENMYFIKEVIEQITLLKRNDVGVFIDCGSFDGDTIQTMIDLNIPFSNAFCFEPDPKTFANLVDRLERLSINNYVTAYKKGVWSESTTLHFCPTNDGASHLSWDGSGIFLDVVSLDNFLNEQQHVAMIKMDIEGSEMEALEGAINTIQRERPILAISVYHKFSDITKIPLFLMERLERYTFLLRHHCGMIETVFYCLPC